MFISQPSNPSTVLEYQNLTLQWSYNLDGQTNVLTRVINATGLDATVASRSLTGNTIIAPGFENQFIASISDTEAILTILTVPRSFNEEKYKLGVIASRSSFDSSDVVISVQCKYKATLFLKIGTQDTAFTVLESGPVPIKHRPRISTAFGTKKLLSDAAPK